MIGPKRVGSSEGKSAKGVLYALVIVVVIIGGAYTVYKHQQKKIDNLNKQAANLQSQVEKARKTNDKISSTYIYTSQKGLEIKVYHPLTNDTVSSPLVIIGEVPGNWSFEASFPVQFVDNKGNIIAQSTAQVLGDWQTDQLVPFSAKLEYKMASAGTGKIILKKDNPSGLATNADLVTIPVNY